MWRSGGAIRQRRSPRSASISTAISVEPLIVELDGRPIAYLQSYDPHLEDDHPYADQPFGTLGIDLSIGRPELVGIGHGSAIVRQFVDELFEEGAPRVIIDPDPANARAIRAYEKAGFRPIDRRQSDLWRRRADGARCGEEDERRDDAPVDEQKPYGPALSAESAGGWGC